MVRRSLAFVLAAGFATAAHAGPVATAARALRDGTVTTCTSKGSTCEVFADDRVTVTCSEPCTGSDRVFTVVARPIGFGGQTSVDILTGNFTRGAAESVDDEATKEAIAEANSLRTEGSLIVRTHTALSDVYTKYYSSDQVTTTSYDVVTVVLARADSRSGQRIIKDEQAAAAAAVAAKAEAEAENAAFVSSPLGLAVTIGLPLVLTAALAGLVYISLPPSTDVDVRVTFPPP